MFSRNFSESILSTCIAVMRTNFQKTFGFWMKIVLFVQVSWYFIQLLCLFSKGFQHIFSPCTIEFPLLAHKLAFNYELVVNSKSSNDRLRSTAYEQQHFKTMLKRSQSPFKTSVMKRFFKIHKNWFYFDKIFPRWRNRGKTEHVEADSRRGIPTQPFLCFQFGNVYLDSISGSCKKISGKFHSQLSMWLPNCN